VVLLFASFHFSSDVWDVRPLFRNIYVSPPLKNSAHRGDVSAKFLKSDGTRRPTVDDNDDGLDQRGDATPPPARSHTADEFPLHTDCSFEEPPPRYITLFVMREDENQGGYSTFVDTQLLMKYLSRKALATLHSSIFTVRVPPEFFKGNIP
jgi:hypothetical protein